MRSEVKKFSQKNNQIGVLKTKVFSSEVQGVSEEESDIMELNTPEIDYEKLADELGYEVEDFRSLSSGKEPEISEILTSNEDDVAYALINELLVDTASDEVRTYSVGAIKDRIREAKMSVRMRFQRLIRDYKVYAKSVKSGKAEELEAAKEMFINDLMGIINQVTPEVMEGKMMSTLLGFNVVSPELAKIGNKLSPIMRKSLQYEKATGDAPPKNLYEKLSALYVEMINELKRVVFEDSTTDVSMLQKTQNKKVDTKIYSRTPC